MWSLSIPPGTSPNLSGMGLAKFGGLLRLENLPILLDKNHWFLNFWGISLTLARGVQTSKLYISIFVQECHARSIPIGSGNSPSQLYKTASATELSSLTDFVQNIEAHSLPPKKWETMYINHVNSSPFIPMIGTTKGLLVLPLLFWEPLNSLHGCTYRPQWHGTGSTYKPSKSNKSKNDSSESTHITWNQWNW